ncbi:hypothetical protein HOLleu_44403 [Holothuria leucospilota]|uniref:Uncharacterized protein n=1 Tax=Holothuria leucospilota TaxID=206669 RepID=A0A9Q0YCH4_HOLLE|nr:hypothetical protein HOLleu_44403 [Holothuria leucospilota]
MFSFTGRGVVAKTTFERGEFLLQYSGSLKSAEEANTLEDVLTKAGSTELERPSVTVNANVANEEVSTDLNRLTPINSRNKFSSTNAKSSVADAVNPDKTEKDGNKSTDSKLADKDPTDEAISSDLEETFQIVRPI